MRHINKLPETPLLIEAGALIVAARLALSLLPFGYLQRLATDLGKPRRRSIRDWPTDSAPLCRAIMIVSRYVPKATCLTQALAAQVLLGRHGHATHLRIGVAKPTTGFHAHAWLEDAQGQILIGHTDRTQFVVLPSIDTAVAT
jgi:Transglutaminase-like superfamily